jgi:hypothetical protein
MFRRFGSSPVVLALLLLAPAPAGRAQTSRPIEKFQAFAAALGTGRSAVVDIAINRWSTDEEREMLLSTVQEFGSNRLADALQKIRPPVGYIRTSGSIAYDLYYARNHANPDGSRRIVLATNRWVTFREAANNTRSMQYQVTVIELHINADGKGEGKLVPAAKVKWDRAAHRIEIENYSALPVDLLEVHAVQP